MTNNSTPKELLLKFAMAEKANAEYMLKVAETMDLKNGVDFWKLRIENANKAIEWLDKQQ